MAWSYKREERQFPIIPEGEYRIRIREANKAVSKKGRDMLALQFDVSGRNEILYHYIVFLDDKPEITNRQLTQFFDSFKDIADGDFNLRNWIGKVGACKIKHEETDYNGGSTQARIHYFIEAGKQGTLPQWKEPVRDGEKKNWTDAGSDDFAPIPDGVEVEGLPLF